MDNQTNRASYTQRIQTRIQQVIRQTTKHFRRTQTPLSTSTPISTSTSNILIEHIEITDLQKASKFQNQRRSVNKEAVEV
jgi:hypothetical protein